MKKLIFFTVACCLMFLFVGCNNQTSNQDNSQQITKNETKTFVRSKWEGNTYINEFLNMKCDFSPSWEHKDDKFLADKMNLDVSVLQNDDEFAQKAKELQTIYDLNVIDDETGSNIIMIYQNVDLYAKKDVTPEEYVKLLSAQFQQESEINYQVGDKYDLEIAGKKFIGLPLTSTQYNLSQGYYVYEEGNLMSSFIVTTRQNLKPDDVMKNFVKIK